MKRLILLLLTAFIGICLFSQTQQAQNLNTETKEQIDSANIQKNTVWEFDLLTYNVWGLPVWLPGMDKKKRYPRIVEALNNKKITFACLQETFDKKLRKELATKLSKDYHHFQDFACNKRMNTFFKTDCFGGLTTLSLYPILQETFFPHPEHPEMQGIERKGGKGFLLSIIETPLGKINVINTHLHAGRSQTAEKVRLHQIKALGKTLKTLKAFNLPTFLCGDLNSLHPDLSDNPETCQIYNYLVDSLSFSDFGQKLNIDDITYDVNNEYTQNFLYNTKVSSKFDYILFYIPENYSLKPVEEKVAFDKEEMFSDHYGVRSRFAWRKR